MEFAAKYAIHTVHYTIIFQILNSCKKDILLKVITNLPYIFINFVKNCIGFQKNVNIYYSSNAAGWLDTCMESNCNIKPFFPMERT